MAYSPNSNGGGSNSFNMPQLPNINPNFGQFSLNPQNNQYIQQQQNNQYNVLNQNNSSSNFQSEFGNQNSYSFQNSPNFNHQNALQQNKTTAYDVNMNKSNKNQSYNIQSSLPPPIPAVPPPIPIAPPPIPSLQQNTNQLQSFNNNISLPQPPPLFINQLQHNDIENSQQQPQQYLNPQNSDNQSISDVIHQDNAINSNISNKKFDQIPTLTNISQLPENLAQPPPLPDFLLSQQNTNRSNSSLSYSENSQQNKSNSNSLGTPQISTNSNRGIITPEINMPSNTSSSTGLTPQMPSLPPLPAKAKVLRLPTWLPALLSWSARR